ncbi:hypothetical protein MKX08_002282 [Trichoderma sp. CBMAI-0020]|nr:hypothetical protein MKX08_002282 [Trichoderma sp. CBMAI-0020]
MASWYCYPQEIRSMILDQVFRTGAACRNLGACTAVCRGWQTYIEPKNFPGSGWYNISGCASSFQDIAAPRAAFPRRANRSKEITKSSQGLCFSFWKSLAPGKMTPRVDIGLVDNTRPVLELSVHSPSDMKHRFDVFALNKDDYPHELDESCTSEEFDDYVQRKMGKDFDRGQVCTAAVGNRTNIEHLRMFAEIQPNFEGLGCLEFPSINYIKTLIIRRQNFRSFNPGTVAEIARSFRSIGSLVFEPITRDPDPFSNRASPSSKAITVAKYYGNLGGNCRANLAKGWLTRAFDLFEAAAFAALQMPQLQTLEIWDGLGLDLWPLNNEFIAAWDRVARMHIDQSMWVLTPEFPDDDEKPRSLYVVIGYLEFREKIVHQLSLREFEWYYNDWTRRVERRGAEQVRKFDP